MLPGQTHVVSGKKLAPMLASYLTGVLSEAQADDAAAGGGRPSARPNTIRQDGLMGYRPGMQRPCMTTTPDISGVKLLR